MNMTFLEFCGNSSFWDDHVLNETKPKFTECFVTTVPALGPAAWLLITFIFCVVGTRDSSISSIPIRSLNVFKTGLCLVLAILSLFILYANNNYGYKCVDDQSIPTSHIVSCSLLTASFLYVAILNQVNRRRGVVSSWLLWLFWIFVVICGAVPLQDNISYQPLCLSSILQYISFGFSCVQVVLYSLAESPSVYGYERIGKPVCPKPYSSVFSKLFFWWFTPIVRTCYKRTISKDELWDQLPELQAESLVNDLQLRWAAQENIKIRKRQNSSYRSQYCKNGTTPGEKTALLKSNISEDEDDQVRQHPSLHKCCLQLYGLAWFRGACLKLCCDISTLLQPLILKLIINETEKPGDERVLWYGIILAVLLFLFGQLNAVFYVHSNQMMLSLGLKVKTALIGVIYRKTLKVSSNVRKDYTVGEVVNLVSVDCQRIQDAFTYATEILSFFVIIIVGVYELWAVMGTATLGCLLVIAILTCLNALFGKLQQKYMMNILYYKGKRCKLLNEIIFGMKVIKMYAWEPYFSKKIRAIRMKEMVILRKIARVTACSILSAAHSPFMMNFSILLIYTLTSTTEPFNAAKAFLALSVVNVLRFPLTLIPFVITGVIQAFVSIKRIQKFLLTDDVNPDNVQFITASDYAVRIQKGSFTWEKNTDRPTLGGINVNIKEGKLIAVVGQVGSGKSSFISSILGEMEKLDGEVLVKGSVAYVSQEAWIQNLTVRDNILYGHTLSERKYDRVIEGCCLKTDLEILTAGDMTEIGERGINVSGGQKQRINLARAVYSNCDIYLFDDPLSAVDSHVGKDLFKKVIGPEGMLRNKTRILVTHGVHWLPKVDEIIVMDNGRISEQGTFKQLVQHNGPFAQFLQVYLLQDESLDEEDDHEISKIKDDLWDQIEVVTSDGGFTTDDSVFIKEGLSRRQSLRRLSRQNSVITSDGCLSSTMIAASMTRRQSKSRRESKAKILRQSSKIDPTLAVGVEGQLIQEEALEKGSVKYSVLIEYAKAMGIPAAFVVLIALVTQQGLNIYQNFWITFWTEDSYLKNATFIHTQKYTDKKYYYLGMYALLGILQGITLFLFGIVAFTKFVKATGYLHDRGLECLFRSPMSFFDTTPVGRIMNRFSSDIDILDDRFPRTFRVLTVMGSVLVGTIIAIVVVTPLSLAVVIPMLILYIVVIKMYIPSARQLKRIESVTRSPVFNHFSETISGASIIRAYKSVNRFKEEIYRRIDINATFYYAANVGMGWVGIFIESLGNLILLAVAMFGIMATDINGGDIGLALTYAVQIIIAMNIVVRGVSEMQMNVVSIERCEEYTHLPPEADWIQRQRPPLEWPQKGTIQFCNYKTRYRSGLELVLNGINCNIRNGERVGIVGRTGAGKSSLTQALFRLIEPAEGSIVIDDITTTTIGLHDLRRKITILPQDPVLFSDTLRVNLDPLEKFSDNELWKALDRAHLKEYAMNQSGQLMSELGEGGSNLSVGQRQLVCLARTLLHKTNILILDEATAAVDMETDDLIQQTISEEFAECTILSIAHRLNTVMDYDRIMVMDKGMIVEFDEPENLLKNVDGTFYSMAKDARLV
ncbi:ATP-binding cassette sub-family C member 3-like isoform X1 [Mytilus galloprovincialis]|uniref:ATP-binding cassette sub-family C member 3-like isoform X1 n=1 Tax=Mytilus galloprovincialis TaxID=29158 RepID=UPI003F7C744C